MGEGEGEEAMEEEGEEGKGWVGNMSCIIHFQDHSCCCCFTIVFVVVVVYRGGEGRSVSCTLVRWTHNSFHTPQVSLGQLDPPGHH